MDELYRFDPNSKTLWSNPNNIGGACLRVPQNDDDKEIRPGEQKTLATLQGPGIIDILWLTMDWPEKDELEDEALRNRSVILACYWDDARTPAVYAPLSDFFCHFFGERKPFESAFFADPSGRSFQCFIPMPFRKNARIDIINGFHEPIKVWHDIRFRQGEMLADQDGYLHAHWAHSKFSDPRASHTVLPQVEGRGRYLGTHLAMITPQDNTLGWQQSRFQFFLDNQTATPSLMTTSLDDYGGSSWDYDMPYTHRDSGLLFSRYFEGGGSEAGLYYYHRRDPIYFGNSFRLTFKARGGAKTSALLAWLSGRPDHLQAVYLPVSLQALAEELAAGTDVWKDFERRDELFTVAFYYIDHPEGDAPIE